MPESNKTPPLWRAWLRAFVPAQTAVDARERIRVVLGAALGIALTALCSHGLQARFGGAGPWLVAPLGASAVLVFGVPASPLAQPWPVIGGNVVAALWAVACVRVFGGGELVAALAVGGAIGWMLALRCLHPPGGAVALLVSLMGVVDPRFALFPVLGNSMLLVAAGMAYNSATGRSYPHRPLAPPAGGLDTLDAELGAALARHNQILDIDRADLRALLEDVHLQAYRRRLDDVRCGDIMSHAPISVRADTPLNEAWALYEAHRIKALPVIDGTRRLVGIVTPVDFIRAAEADGIAPPTRRVGAIMSRRVRVSTTERHLAELVPLFGGSGHHHIPILDEQERLVGMLTESDVVAALARLRPA